MSVLFLRNWSSVSENVYIQYTNRIVLHVEAMSKLVAPDKEMMIGMKWRLADSMYGVYGGYVISLYMTWVHVEISNEIFHIAPVTDL